MAVPAQDVILRFHDSGESAHQHTAFASKVAEHFPLKCRREEISRTDTNADGKATLFGAARGVLLDGKAGVDARAGQKIAADRRARTLRRDQDHIHALGWDNAGLFAISD